MGTHIGTILGIILSRYLDRMITKKIALMTPIPYWLFLLQEIKYFSPYYTSFEHIATLTR